MAFYGYASVWTVASRKLLKERVFVPISMSNRRKRKETRAGPRLISRERGMRQIGGEVLHLTIRGSLRVLALKRHSMSP